MVASVLLAITAVAAPCHAHANATGSPVVIGDSVTVAAGPALHRRGLGVNARGCRQISEGLRVMRALRPRKTVLALGANGTVSVRQLRAARRLTGQLVLVTPGGRDDGDRGRILGFAHRHALRVIDWARIARAHPRWLAGDGLHLTPLGARAFARTIARAVR
jgi:hypothetical protein